MISDAANDSKDRPVSRAHSLCVQTAEEFRVQGFLQRVNMTALCCRHFIDLASALVQA